MKTLRNLYAVPILTLILAVSAFAGQIQCPGVASGGATSTSDVVTTIILTAVSLVS